MERLPEEADPALLARLEAIFEAAIALPLPQRHSFIEGKCVADPKLRDRLRRLLAAHDEAQAQAPPSPPNRPRSSA